MRKFYWFAALFILGCSGALAQNLEWADDGSVTIITQDDGERITIPADQIGTMFGPDQKPFEGVRIAITVILADPKAASQAHCTSLDLPGSNSPEPRSTSLKCPCPSNSRQY